jgi:hypothetical protein
VSAMLAVSLVMGTGVVEGVVSVAAGRFLDRRNRGSQPSRTLVDVDDEGR